MNVVEWAGASVAWIGLCAAVAGITYAIPAPLETRERTATRATVLGVFLLCFGAYLFLWAGANG